MSADSFSNIVTVDKMETAKESENKKKENHWMTRSTSPQLFGSLPGFEWRWCTPSRQWSNERTPRSRGPSAYSSCRSRSLRSFARRREVWRWSGRCRLEKPSAGSRSTAIPNRSIWRKLGSELVPSSEEPWPKTSFSWNKIYRKFSVPNFFRLFLWAFLPLFCAWW